MKARPRVGLLLHLHLMTKMPLFSQLSPRGADFAIVLTAMGLTTSVASVQFQYVLGTNVTAPTLILPSLVGLLFGVVVVYVQRSRRREQKMRHALESHEQHIAALNADLAEALDEQAERLAQTSAALLHSQKLESIGRLAGGVAHDFNNILTAILHGTELLGPALAGDEHARDILNTMRHTAASGSRLTRKLLTLARREVTQPEPLQVGAMVRGMVPILQRLAGDSIHLKVETQDDCYPVVADRAQLEQVLLNLAINARDAMPAGGSLWIRVGCEPVDAPDTPPFVHLVVQDSGVGMTSDVLERAFEPFFTTKANHRGTGLGLAMVHGIVSSLNGTIHVDSTPGVGTALHVRLPSCPDATLPVPADTQEPLRSTRDATVLLIEDERAVRKLISTGLTRAGYRLITTASGDDAILEAALTPHRIDLIVSDVCLPGMSGPEAVATILDDRPETRVVFMTGHPEEEQKHPLLTRLATGPVLGKPFELPVLLDAVEAALKVPAPSPPTRQVHPPRAVTNT